MNSEGLRPVLEALYAQCNREDLIHPDPLEFVYWFEHPRDREVAGLIAACLAYGRVASILQSVTAVLEAMGPSPSRFLLETPAEALAERYATFKHRWTTGSDLSALLTNVGCVLREHGSLEACFQAHQPREADSTLPGLAGFAGDLRGGRASSLVSAPEKGSACKRLHLYLRWMVRKDGVDPGCWQGVSPSLLVVPLDTHMHRIGQSLGMTRRKQANLAAALDITKAFRAIDPSDPVRYDFALTRLGIRRDMDMDAFLSECGEDGSPRNAAHAS